MTGAATLYEFDLGPGVRAAFTTTRGGVSPQPWSTLNLGLNTGDEPERVLANRARIEDEFGVAITFASQVHGADVAIAPASQGDGRTGPGPVSTRLTCGEADAIVLTGPGTGAGVLVADCVPVLLADSEARVGAVVHAGRAGLVAGVVEAAVGRMIACGAQARRMRAAIGPAACGACYEVPEQMRTDIAQQIPQTASTTRSGTPALDLPAGVIAKLRAQAVPAIERLEICTIESDEFYSYRRAGRAGSATGRFAGILALT